MSAAKILIVDDLAENLLALSALLRADDVELLAARSGAEALELLLRHEGIALALLDVQMPGMDGFELAELMRGNQRSKDVPIIFVTAGITDQQRVFKGYDSGAVDFLVKPIEARVLHSKVSVFLRLHRQAQQIAQELSERTETLRLVEMFNVVLGHDLRNPLATINMAAMVIGHRAADDVSRRSANTVIRAAKGMARMIDDLLDVARIRADGGFSVQRKPGDLGILLEAVVADFRVAHPERAIEFVTQGDASGAWDGDRIGQAVGNLLANAIAHGDAQAPVAVRIDGSASDAVSIEVRNGGVIDPGLLPHLFEPFSGAAEHAARGAGLGLGLHIVERIVAAHGGRIDVRSSDGEGTVFTAVLPRRGD